MKTHYGHIWEDWNEAKEEARQILIEVARSRGVIPYSKLTAKIKKLSIEPHSYAMAAMLGEISWEENEEGRGLLSVVVVHKDGDMMPGPGFFGLAKYLGRDTSDKEKFWIEEIKKVYDYWGK